MLDMKKFEDDVKMFSNVIFNDFENNMLTDGYVMGEEVGFDFAVRKDMNAVFVTIFDNISDFEWCTVGVPLKGLCCPEQIGETIIEQFKDKIAKLQKMVNN